MLEIAVGLAAALLVLAGIVVLAGPALPRALGLAIRRRPALPRGPLRRPPRPKGAAPPAELHPTTARALATAERLAGLLADHGLSRQAGSLRSAAERLRVQEVDGIHALREALRRLRGARVADRADQEILDGLVGRLHQQVEDRAEQLELLPKR